MSLDRFIRVSPNAIQYCLEGNLINNSIRIDNKRSISVPTMSAVIFRLQIVTEILEDSKIDQTALKLKV